MTIIRAVAFLHPAMISGAISMTKWFPERRWQDESGQWWRWAIYETYRSPERQDFLFSEKKVTKARAWQSAHQYGLAMDVVAVKTLDDGTPIPNSWSWDNAHPWAMLRELARDCGLDAPIEWDRAHIEHPSFSEIKAAWRR